MEQTHLTQITTRDASCTVDGQVVPDHVRKQLTAAEAISQAQAATSLDELTLLGDGETRSTVLAAISKRREALTNNEGGSANVDTP